MSEDIKIEESVAEELQTLKEKADMLGIKYSNNIGIDTLKAKINEKIESNTLKSETVVSKAKLRQQIQQEQLKLVRIRLACMNPAKKAWRGEIFTVANEYIGTVKKFVPYDPRFYTNGYHVPYCIYKLLKRKKFLNITSQEDKGKITVHTSYEPEFSIEVLPQLTAKELKELALAQQAGNRID